MNMMKAAVLVEPGRFVVEDKPIPVFAANEVLVKVLRTGICGTDIHIFHGNYALENLPMVPGHEFVGEVADFGSDVSHLAVGQKCLVDINIGCGHCYWCRRNEILNCPEMEQVGISRDGAFAQYLVVPARLVIPAPQDAQDEVLALAEPVACVVRGARKAGVKFGESVVILGAGPMGNLHVQMMRLVGAAPIIVSDISPERCAMAKDVGADIAVSDPSTLKQVVLDATDGRGADHVIESVGSLALYTQAVELLRKGGHLAAFGIVGPDDELPLNILKVVLEENSIKGSVAGMGEDMHDALTLLMHNRFSTERFTKACFPLSKIQEAFDSISDRTGDLKTQIEF